MCDYLQDIRANCKPLPVIACDAKTADDAFAVYAAMKRTEIDQPELALLDLWVGLRAAVYMMFFQAFEVHQ